MSTETCPHCGAERERYDSGFVRYQCGSSMSRHIADDWASTLSSKCYLNQLAQKDAEIEKLRTANETMAGMVLTAIAYEREECAKIADEYALGLERNYAEIIADEIRARGEEK